MQAIRDAPAPIVARRARHRDTTAGRSVEALQKQKPATHRRQLHDPSGFRVPGVIQKSHRRRPPGHQPTGRPRPNQQNGVAGTPELRLQILVARFDAAEQGKENRLRDVAQRLGRDVRNHRRDAIDAEHVERDHPTEDEPIGLTGEKREHRAQEDPPTEPEHLARQRRVPPEPVAFSR